MRLLRPRFRDEEVEAQRSDEMKCAFTNTWIVLGTQHILRRQDAEVLTAGSLASRARAGCHPSWTETASLSVSPSSFLSTPLPPAQTELPTFQSCQTPAPHTVLGVIQAKGTNSPERAKGHCGGKG